MNPANVLALLSDMYGQVAALQEQLADVTRERDMLAGLLRQAHEHQASGLDGAGPKHGNDLAAPGVPPAA